MKKVNFYAVLFAAAVFAVSCSKDDNGGNGGNGGDGNGLELSGDITEDLVLESGKEYTLSGGMHVKAGATLTIEPGVVITAKDDSVVDYILVEQDARIDARGTAENPIVMTAESQKHGAWGGLHICGKAPVNIPAGTGISEIGDAPYGGSDANDNSGVLSYIRIEYAGYAFTEEKEANGFTFYGVGAGTQVDHLQAYKGSDDGFEWFGGTVNVKYIVSTDNTDDSFDWTEGWSGKGQFMVAQQISSECDCLIEADNNSNDEMASPVSHPVLSNLTLVGNGSEENKRGIRLRAGTQAEIYNALVAGKPQGLTVETEGTENALRDGVSKLEHVLLSTAFSSAEGIYTESMFLDQDNGNSVNHDFVLDGISGIVDGGKDMSSDSFFEKTSYCGAVDPESDWTSSWTK